MYQISLNSPLESMTQYALTYLEGRLSASQFESLTVYGPDMFWGANALEDLVSRIAVQENEGDGIQDPSTLRVIARDWALAHTGIPAFGSLDPEVFATRPVECDDLLF